MKIENLLFSSPRTPPILERFFTSGGLPDKNFRLYRLKFRRVFLYVNVKVRTFPFLVPHREWADLATPVETSAFNAPSRFRPAKEKDPLSAIFY